MPTEIIGLDHIYLTVAEPGRSEVFYDRVLVDILGFRKNAFQLNGEPHVNYYNRHFGIVLRPARSGAAGHDPYAPGLHHLCLRVDSRDDVDRVGRALAIAGISASAPRAYPQYALDYYALHVEDPDGLRLEITNFRDERRQRMHDWDGVA
jgi:catechol 2,3-dioxygenase-like lactoylglutathione lyase family enzyme